MYAEKNGEKYLVDFIRLPDQIYQVFYSVVDSKGQLALLVLFGGDGVL